MQVQPGATITPHTGTRSGFSVAGSEEVATLTDMFIIQTFKHAGLLVAGATAFVSGTGQFLGPVLQLVKGMQAADL